MQIKEMFQKPIDRDIKGVIKVGQGDNENVRQELEEYVVTRELSKHFADFFASYKKGLTGQTDKMGVWISGFFGSGKSHFLKILSYLLSNKEAGGKPALDYFFDEDKITDPVLRANMQLCADCAATTDVILFNIDSKSEQAGKQSKDAIVSVFLKVFNEMQGYCGVLPHLADLERQLDEAGRYDEFKAEFAQAQGKAWEVSRQRFDFIQDVVVDVLADMGFLSEAAARNFCEKAVGEYDISIEGFAALVKEYIERKGPQQRIVFLVDEIGQYISDDSKLMLNLQTVTEDLGTACGGRAWIIVTSQQDIDSIAQNMGLRANDFSRIQGRFDTRLSLSSANVDEVIKKRILAKNDTAALALRLLFEQKETIIKNLITWNDGVEKKLYAGEEDFTQVYPFIPYQFNLLASVLTSIRTHGASGKHLSEGERSMLSLFQESAVQWMGREQGALIPFNLFYDALHRFLDHSHAGVILRAQENEVINPDGEKHCFAVEVLKALFMVKYVSEVTATEDNLTSLLADHIDADRIDLKKRVADALKKLTGQKLVQKNGEIYVFLTDEEQEINREIDSQSVESAEVTAKISEMIFEEIYSEKRWRYPKWNGRYTFAFSQMVDEHLHRSNQSYDVSLRIITPGSDLQDDSALRMRSSQAKEVLVALPPSRVFYDELHSALKIEKYLKVGSSSLLSKYEEIKLAKGKEMRLRREAARVALVEALKEAVIYINGDKAQIGAKEVSARLSEALGKLIQTVYHKLDYIEQPLSDADIRKLFAQSAQQSMLSNDAQRVNAKALNDLLGFISLSSKSRQKVSMKSLLERFTKAPYGFVAEDVQWLVAKLFREGEIAFTLGGVAVTLLNTQPDNLVRAITSTREAEKLLCERRERIDEAQKKQVREVMRELFGTDGASDDDDQIMRGFQERCRQMLKGELSELAAEISRETRGNSRQYPGRTVLEEGRALLRELSQLESPPEFYRTVIDRAKDCSDFARRFTPVKAFYAGQQKTLFASALNYIDIYNDSKTFIVNDEIEAFIGEIIAIVRKSEPYGEIPRLPGLLERYADTYSAVLDGMMPPIAEAIAEAKRQVLEELEQKTYRNELFGSWVNMFRELKDKAEGCTNVAKLQNITVEADVLKMRLLRDMSQRDERLAAEQARAQAAVQSCAAEKPVLRPAPPPRPKTKRVSINSVNRSGTWRVKSQAEIDERLEQLRRELYAQLEADAVLEIRF